MYVIIIGKSLNTKMLGCGEIATRLICNAVMQVYPSPTIAVLSTGDELVEPTTANLSRGQVLRRSRITYISLLVELVVSFGLITEVGDGFFTGRLGFKTKGEDTAFQ